MKYNHIHPYATLEYLSRFAFLFIIPVLQQLILIPHGMSEFLGKLGFNILICIGIIIYCIIEYRNFKYLNSSNFLSIQTGVLINRRSYILYDKIHFLTITKKIIPTIFGATKLLIGMPSKGVNNNLHLTLLSKALVEKIKYKDLNFQQNTTKMWKIALMSATWSNPATGLLLFAPFVNRIGIILGQEIAERVYSTVDISWQLIAWGVPPLTATITYILMLGWIISLLHRFVNYYGFSTIYTKDKIITKRGFISTTTDIIDKPNINAIFIKQTLFMRLFKLYSASVSIAGTKKYGIDSNMIIAASTFSELYSQLSKMFPNCMNYKNEIRPNKEAFKSFIILPISAIIISPTLIFLLSYFNINREISYIIVIFIESILVLWLITRIIAFKISKFSITDKTVISTGYRGLNLITCIIFIDKLQNINITKNALQRFSNRCNIQLFFFSNKRVYNTVHHLNIDNTYNQINRLYNNN